METISSGTAGFQVRSAADCVSKLTSSTEAARVLIARLDRTLYETRALKPDDVPIGQAEIAAVLAEALSRLKIADGYKKIEGYFASADWNTRRDREFFDGIAARAHHRPEMTETFYLALTRIPASGSIRLARACSLFHRMNDRWAVRDEPKFVHGVLSALARLEGGKGGAGHDYAKSECENSLLSQLLVEKMRGTFLKTLLDQLSAEERRILDRFLAKVTPPPDGEVAEQLTATFFAAPWAMESSAWQKTNPEASCEDFHGDSSSTRASELWCVKCSSKTGLRQKEFYFYPNAEGTVCTLQQVWLYYPTTSRDAASVVAGRMAQHMGPGSQPSRVHGPGSAYWENIFSWSWQGREAYLFRNISPTFRGGLPQVEILTKDRQLLSAIKREEAAERSIEKEQEQREATKQKRLYHDVAKSLPDLIQRLEKAQEPESRYLLILELLSKITKKGPHRAAQLYLADRLIGELGDATNVGKLKDWERKQQALSAHGVVYIRYKGEIYTHNHLFLSKIVEEGLAGYWAEDAFLQWLVEGIGEEFGKDYSCEKPGRFERVSTRGEDFLTRNPTSHIRKQLLVALAEAHETAWSLSQASPNDELVRAADYQVGAHDHRRKAISYYEQFIREFPGSSEAVLSRERLKRLRLGVDTNARHFFYGCH